MKRIVVLVALGALALCQGCGSADPTPVDPSPPDAGPAPCAPPADGTAPTYRELFARYFAPGTPGHCATGHCHASPEFNVWLCGDTKDSCYTGMVQVGLISPKNPAASLLGNALQSPLTWVSPTGNMPFDAPGPFAPGRDAIVAWVAACAQND